MSKPKPVPAWAMQVAQAWLDTFKDRNPEYQRKQLAALIAQSVPACEAEALEFYADVPEDMERYSYGADKARSALSALRGEG